LPAHKLVVGHAGVKRFDDKVAIVIRIGPIVVVLETGAFREAGHIKPMPSPALAVAGALEKFGHELRPGFRRLVPQKGLHFFRGRRKAEQIERSAANKRSAVGRWIWLELHLLKPGENEGVDGGLP